MTVQIEVREETATKLQTIASALRLSLDDYLTGVATFAPSQPVSNPWADDPAFAMTFRDYLAWAAAERKTMTLELQTRRQDWLRRQFESQRAAWSLVIGGQVRESSPRLDDYLSLERLMKLGTEHDLIPFVFSRPPLADEAGATRSREVACEWVEDWQRSPLCEVNSARQALAGRNLLLGFPLTVELNGAERKTTVIRC